MRLQQARCTDNHEALGRRQPGGDHVDLHGGSESNPGIEAVSDDIDEAVVTHELELECRVCHEKVWQKAVHQKRQGRARCVDA
jgi:hypothetical protein